MTRLKNIEKSKIWKSEHRDEAIEMMKQGLSARQISDWLAGKGVYIKPIGVRSFRNTLMVKPEGQQAYVREEFRKMDEQIDALKEHVELLKMQKERILEQREEEKNTGKHINKLQLHREIIVFDQFLKDHLIMKQMLGKLPTPKDKDAFNKSMMEMVRSKIQKENAMIVKKKFNKH